MNRAGSGFAGEVYGNLNGYLLAAAHEDQVDVFDVSADRVTLDVLGQSEALFTLNVEGQQRVGDLHRQEGLVTGKGNVDRVNSATVENGGHEAGTARAAGSALTEFGTNFGGNRSVRDI